MSDLKLWVAQELGAGKAPFVIVVAPMHRLAQDWIERHNLPRDKCKTATSTLLLRGRAPSFPVVLLDTSVRFQDSSVLSLLRQRFTNVRHERF